MGNMNDVFAVARIRVKEKYLLTDADIAQMVSMKDEESVLSFLKEKGWGSDAGDKDAESVLLAEENKAMAVLKELNVDQDVLEVLDYPNLYNNLKAGIKEICTAHSNPGAFYEDASIGREKMIRILQDKAFEKLPSHMRLAAQNGYEAMLQGRDGQMCDVIIDRACLDAMEKVAATSKHQILRDYLEMTVTVSNIRIAVRAAKTGKSRNFLKAALSPCRNLNVQQMAAAASESLESLYSFLTEAGYAEAVEALKVSSSSFERWCDNAMIESIRPQKRNPFTLGPVVAYYLARRNEIKTARIILTAKANDLPEGAIRERMREMYV